MYSNKVVVVLVVGSCSTSGSRSRSRSSSINNSFHLFLKTRSLIEKVRYWVVLRHGLL